MSVAVSVTASVPKDQTVKSGDQDGVMRIFTKSVLGTRDNGTANLFANKITDTTLKMCFVTADHVVRLQSKADPKKLNFGFRSAFGDTSVDAFNFAPDQISVELGRSTGDGTVVDMAFVGVTIDLTKLPEQQKTSLLATKPLKLATAPKEVPKGGLAFTEYGFGRTGLPPGENDPAEYKDFAYIGHAANAAESVGVQRYFNNTILEFKTVTGTDPNTGQKYSYDGLAWDLRKADKGAVAGEGTGGTGDSGAGLRVGDDPKTNEIIGILTTGFGLPARNGDFLWLYSPLGGGEGVRMTDDNRQWLVKQCNAFLGVPEPGSALLMLTGLLLGALRRPRCLVRFCEKVR